ncbi:MAG: undecaprenyl-diphosphate phosphatase [Bacillota bacterium]|nr:undecaprenyl-diphosphate phosphatase [Bacillota bacterium]
MNVLQAVLLGVVQGLTEFLPVSSSGHLVLMQHLLGLPEVGVSFDVLLHLATLLAVVIYFRRELAQALLQRDWHLGRLLLVGSLPAAVLGLLLEDFFAALFHSVQAVGAAFLLTGVILYAAERWGGRVQKSGGWQALGMQDAFFIGLGQAVAIIPGVSRSGSTIAAGMARGIERTLAARFSFFLSIPVIAGAGLLELPHLWAEGAYYSPAALAGGFIAAFLGGWLAISTLLAILQRWRLSLFSWYVWLLGLAILGGKWM